MPLYHERKAVWRGEQRAQFRPRSPENDALTAVTADGVNVALLMRPSSLCLMTIVPGAPMPVMAQLDGGQGRVVCMCWSVSGRMLAVGMENGRVALMSSMGVPVDVLDLQKQCKPLSSFAFLSENTLLLTSGEGGVFMCHVLTGRSESVTSVHRHHCWPQLRVCTERRICAMSGVLREDICNVTLWSYDEDGTRWRLLYSLREMLTGLQAWRRGLPQEEVWCHLDFAPDGGWIVVSTVGQPPLVLQLEGREISRVRLDGSLVDIMQTANDGIFCEDGILAVTTDMEKVLFLEVSDGLLHLRSSDSISGQTALVARCMECGILCISADAAPGGAEVQLSLEAFYRQSAADHISMLLEKKDFSTALRVSDIEGLSTEAVYKEMWKARETSFPAFAQIEEFLSHVRDVAWIGNICAEVTCTTLEDQHQILQHGLVTCRDQIRTSAADRDSFVGKCALLLRQLEMLHTFEALHPGCYTPEAFHSFRVSSLEEITRSFCRMGNCQAVEVLLKHHAYSLFPKMLSVLLDLPCTMQPKEYRTLLPCVGLTPHSLGFTTQIPTEIVKEFVEWLPEDGAGLLGQNPPEAAMAEIQNSSVLELPILDGPELTEFYLAMAGRIESETGSIADARALLEYGIQNKVKSGLAEAVHRLKVFEAWLCAGSSFWNWTSASFSELTSHQRIDRVLQQVPKEDLLDRLSSTLIPLCRRLPADDRTELQELLCQYALQCSAKLFEELVSVECRDACLFGTTPAGLQKFSRAIVSAIETVDKIADWDAVYEAVDLVSRQDIPAEEGPEACNQMAELMEDCHFGSLLEKYGLRISYSQMQNLSLSEGERLVKSVLGRIMRSGISWSDSEWEEAHADLMTIALRVSHLSKTLFDIDALKQDYFQTMLRASQFELAKDYMDKQLASGIAEDLAWKTGREILCSVTDLDNLTSLEDAQRCFDLCLSSDRASKEVQKLKALTLVKANFSVALLPLEMEQFTSKAELVARILASAEKHYKKRDKLLVLSQELEFSDEEFFAAWELLCQTSLKYKDLRKAKELFQDLRDRGAVSAWNIAHEILKMEEGLDFLSLQEKENLWKFVIVHCDVGLQDCIACMSESLPATWEKDDGADPLLEQMLSCEDDPFACLADPDDRQQTKAQEKTYTDHKTDIQQFVCSAVDSVSNDTSESAAFVRAFLEASPHEMVSMLKGSPQFLKEDSRDREDIRAFEERLDQLQAHDELQSSCQRIQSMLPALDVQRFCSGENQMYRMRIVKELARYAGELLYAQERHQGQRQSQQPGWREVLSTSLQEGELFGEDSWSLKCQFVCTLCGLVDRKMPVLEEAVVSVEEELMEKHTLYVQQVLGCAWKDANYPSTVAFILQILLRCLAKERSLEDPEAALLVQYVEQISRLGDGSLAEMDFRIPIFSVLQSCVQKYFGIAFEWERGISELQHIFSIMNERNLGDLLALFEKLHGHLGSRAPSAVSVSQFRLLSLIKDLISAPTSKGRLQEREYWSVAMSHFSANDLTAFLEYAVLDDPDLVLETLRGWDDHSRDLIASWKGCDLSQDERLCILKLILEEGMEALARMDTEDSTAEIEKWSGELKKLRRLHATEDLRNIGIHVTGDDFGQNIKHVIHSMILSDHSYDVVFEAVKSFAERSGEGHRTEILERLISETLKSWTVECVSSDSKDLHKVLSALEDSANLPAVSTLQEALWLQLAVFLRETKDFQSHPVTVTSGLMADVIRGRIWEQRPWSPSSSNKWLVFSFCIFFELRRLEFEGQELDDLQPAALDSEQSVTAFLDSLLQSLHDFHTAVSVLEAFSSFEALLDAEVSPLWLSSHYSKACHQCVKNGDPLSVMRFLCQHRDVSRLQEAGMESLLALLRTCSENLAVCAGLMSSSESLKQKSLAALNAVEGDANTLAILLYAEPGQQLAGMMENSNWLPTLLEGCPPHPDLIPCWDVFQQSLAAAAENQAAEEVVEDAEMPTSEAGDGWDIDDELVFEEEAASPGVQLEQEELGGSDGWSDVDALESALGMEQISAEGTGTTFPRTNIEVQAEAQSASPKKESPLLDSKLSAMAPEDAQFVGSCCFPSLLALLVLQSRVDCAAPLLSKKLNLHGAADSLTAGRVQLEQFFKSCSQAPITESPSCRVSIQRQWSGPVLLSLLEEAPALCMRAIDLMGQPP